MKRSRGRGRRQQNPANRSYDSNGPEVRVRGTASQIYEKYQALARDAQSSGDRIKAENLQQHAEHYYRLALPFQTTRPDAEAGNDAEDAATMSNSGNADVGTDGGQAAPLFLAADNAGAEVANGFAEDVAGDDEAKPKGRRRGPFRRRRSDGDDEGEAETAVSTAASDNETDEKSAAAAVVESAAPVTAEPEEAAAPSGE